MNPELRYLHAFRAVCEGGSLRAAASSLHRTEQAVSYQLRKLEEALGMPLFDRGNGPLVPNAAGERLLAFCRGMGRDWDRLHADMRAEDAAQAPVRIAAVSVFGRYELLPLFRTGPLVDVPLQVQYPTAAQVMRLVESGAADLGFVHLLLPHDRLTLTPVAEEEIALVVPGGSTPPALEPDALAAMPFVTYEESDYVFASWFTRVLGSKPGRLRSVAHFEELEEVLDWVAAGRGVSIVPRACATAHEQRGAVAVPPARLCRNTVYAVQDPVRTHPAIASILAALRARGSAPAA